MVFENGNWFVLNVEPLLRLFGMLNVSELTEISLFKRWDLVERELFWESYDKVKSHSKKLWIFRWLTCCSFRALKDADEDELMVALENLEDNTPLVGEELRQYLIWVVASRLYDISKAAPPRTVSCIVDGP
jgi:hypothetical protein